MIINGDCLQEMAKMPENSIDFIVTDPPYGLHFMGKDWDGKVPGPDIWSEALRICKPGSMLAAFGGSRTHHHLMISLEKAGWEIRDVIMWLYGSGFPKSMNIGKAIDKAKGEERIIGHIPDRWTGKGNNLNFSTDRKQEFCKVTEPSSDLGKIFDGYGTALKPAYEPIILCQKPLDGTYAQNVEKWGLGGINIDESRIEGSKPNTIRGAGGQHSHLSNLKAQGYVQDDGKGRWPANIIFDEEAAELLDEQSGDLKSGKPGCRKKEWNGYAKGLKILEKENGYGDSGGASRFFYCAKASTKERGADNKHPTVKPLSLMKYIIKLLAPPGKPVLLDPFAGSGSTLIAAKELGIDFIGIEMQPDYCEIAYKRLDAVKEEQQLFFAFKDK